MSFHCRSKIRFHQSEFHKIQSPYSSHLKLHTQCKSYFNDFALTRKKSENPIICTCVDFTEFLQNISKMCKSQQFPHCENTWKSKSWQLQKRGQTRFGTL